MHDLDAEHAGRANTNSFMHNDKIIMLSRSKPKDISNTKNEGLIFHASTKKLITVYYYVHIIFSI